MTIVFLVLSGLTFPAWLTLFITQPSSQASGVMFFVTFGFLLFAGISKFVEIWNG